jgi:hypothetical protein
MDELDKKEEQLEHLQIDDEIASRRVSIAEKKAIERDAKRRYGKDWKKILGIARAFRPNREVMQDLYGVGSGMEDLKGLSRLNPRKLR